MPSPVLSPLMPWLALTALLAAPLWVVVSVVHSVAEGVPGAPLWAFCFLVTIVYAILSRAFLHDLAALRHYAALASHSDKPPVPPSLTIVGPTHDVRAAIERLIEVRNNDRTRLNANIGALTAVLDRLPDPVFMLSRDANVIEANRAATDLLPGLPPQASLSAVFRNPELLEMVAAALSDGQPRETDIALTGLPVRTYRAWIAGFPRPLENGACGLMRMVDQTEVKRVESLQAEFIANASHELRTPLATLTGYIETLRHSARDDPEARERFLATMDKEAQRMSRLVHDLLSLSRIEQQEHDRPGDKVDLGDAISSVVDLLRPVAAAKEQDFAVDLPDDATVTGDSDQLTRVFLNLFDNAIKYGKNGSIIRVVGRVVSPMLSVAVIDEGAGIAPEHVPRLSERFYQVDADHSRSPEGVGLGLSIVKHILSRHSGRLEIMSTPGQGSTFTAFIPCHGQKEKSQKDKSE